MDNDCRYRGADRGNVRPLRGGRGCSWKTGVVSPETCTTRSAPHDRGFMEHPAGSGSVFPIPTDSTTVAVDGSAEIQKTHARGNRIPVPNREDEE